MEEEIYLPSVEEFRDALIAFVLAVSVVAFHRGREFGPKRFSFVARHLADEFRERFTLGDAEAIISEFREDSMSSLGALYEELIYIAWSYNRYAADAGVELSIPSGEAVFGEEVGDMFDDQTVKDIGTVKGSIGALMSKLPKWAQKILEALLEALKLTRGG